MSKNKTKEPSFSILDIFDLCSTIVIGVYVLIVTGIVIFFDAITINKEAYSEINAWALNWVKAILVLISGGAIIGTVRYAIFDFDLKLIHKKVIIIGVIFNIITVVVVMGISIFSL